MSSVAQSDHEAYLDALDTGEPDAGPPRTRASLGWRRKVSIAAMVGLLIVAGFLMLYPGLMLVYGSVRTSAPGLEGEFSAAALVEAYGSRDTYRVWLNSVVMSLTMTITSMSLAVFFCWVVARTNTPGKRLLFPVMVASMALPPLFFATGWSMLGNPRAGTINAFLMSWLPLTEPLVNIESWPGLILVLTLGWTPFAFLLTYGAFMAMDRSLEEAAAVAGSGRFRTFVTIDLPVLAPALLGVAILSFIRGLQFFDMPLLIGRPAGIDVFSTHIYDYVRNFVPARYAEASALSLLLLATLGVLLAVQWKVLGTRKFTTISGKGHRTESWDIGRWRWVCLGVIVVFTVLGLLLPIAQLVLGSLQRVYGVSGGELSLDNYRTALSRPVVINSLRNTALIATIGGFLVSVLCGVIAYVTLRARAPGRRLLELMTWVPWAMPGVVLGLAMLWSYLSIPALTPLYGTRTLMIIALGVGAVPLGVRVMSAAIQQVSAELEESSRLHGASWPRMFVGIVMRLVAPSFLASWVVVALSISGDLAIPILLYTPGNEVVSVAIFQLFQSAEAPVAAAVFVMIIGFVLAFVLLTSLVRKLGSSALGVRAAAPRRSTP